MTRPQHPVVQAPYLRHHGPETVARVPQPVGLPTATFLSWLAGIWSSSIWDIRPSVASLLRLEPNEYHHQLDTNAVLGDVDKDTRILEKGLILGTAISVGGNVYQAITRRRRPEDDAPPTPARPVEEIAQIPSVPTRCKSYTRPTVDPGRDVDVTWDESPPFSTGGSSEIYEGVHRAHGKVAIKKSKLSKDARKPKKQFEQERIIWLTLRHVRILLCYEAFYQDDNFYLVSQFAEGGSLADWIFSDKYGLPTGLQILIDVADALAYLHALDLVHGDIKSPNVLLSSDHRGLLSDFGLSKTIATVTDTTGKGAGTFRWQSPELWLGESRSFASDIYALAMVIVEVATRQYPYSHLDNAAVMLYVMKGERPLFEGEGMVDEHTMLRACLWDVAEACWSNVPHERLSAKEAYRRLLGCKSSF